MQYLEVIDLIRASGRPLTLEFDPASTVHTVEPDGS
jgi:hypothetical protein